MDLESESAHCGTEWMEDGPGWLSDAFDPERLITCPYNKYHQIRACRFPYHLVKCKKSYPEVAKKLATCPFNARHLVPEGDLSDHITKCSDKRCIETDIVFQSSGSQREHGSDVSTWQAPPCSEDWEAELEESDTPFVWGTISSGTNSPSFGKKCALPLRLRTPASFPNATSQDGSS